MPLNAIPHTSEHINRPKSPYWPFSSASVDETTCTLLDYDQILSIERRVLHSALRHGQTPGVIRAARSMIDHVEARRRAGLARLRALGVG